MQKTIPRYLKLVSPGAELGHRADADLATWLAASAAFEELTGCSLQYASGPPPKHEANLMWSAPVDPGVGNTPGHIKLFAKPAGQSSAEKSPAGQTPTGKSLGEVKPLAGALGDLWGEVLRTRLALWRCEAELATSVPVTSRADEPRHLAERLEAVLAAGAESLGCQAAALYLLDAGTSELKLRASWGLARRQLTEPARSLRGAAADLEALLGHAVVMNDPALFGFWRVPQPCGSAVCVPVSSPTIPLGTLWLFADDRRDFSDRETNLLEIVAGRLAGDLERETLLAELDRARRTDLDVAASELLADGPPPSPLVDGWEIFGWQSPRGGKGQTWLDWFEVTSDQLGVVVGSAASGTAADRAVAAARTGARAASHYDASAGAVLKKLNSAFWAGNLGAAQVGLGYLRLDTHHGMVQTALCGACGWTIIDPAKPEREPLAGGAHGKQTVGGEERIDVFERRARLPRGGTLVMWAGPPNLAAKKAELAPTAVAACREGANQSGAEQAARIGQRLAAVNQSQGPWAVALVRRSR